VYYASWKHRLVFRETLTIALDTPKLDMFLNVRVSYFCLFVSLSSLQTFPVRLNYGRAIEAKSSGKNALLYII
jgi:hypothetical protein